MNLPEDEYQIFFKEDVAALINIGAGQDSTSVELLVVIVKLVGIRGELVYGSNKSDGMMRKVWDVS